MRLKGFKDLGVSMFYLSGGHDNGDMIGQERYSIDISDRAEDGYNRMIDTGKKLVIKYLHLIVEGRASRIPQDESNIKYFNKPRSKDNMIYQDNESIDFIYKKIKILFYPDNRTYIERMGKI